MSQQLDPTSIMQTATSFWASKALLTAVEFDLFSTLGDGSMTAEQLGAALGLHPRGRYDFERYRTVTDVGGALALLSRLVAARHPHLRFQTFDLPPVRVHAQNAIDGAGLADRIQVVSGDFFVDPFPQADVLTMGNVL